MADRRGPAGSVLLHLFMGGLTPLPPPLLRTDTCSPPARALSASARPAPGEGRRHRPQQFSRVVLSSSLGSAPSLRGRGCLCQAVVGSGRLPRAGQTWVETRSLTKRGAVWGPGSPSHALPPGTPLVSPGLSQRPKPLPLAPTSTPPGERSLSLSCPPSASWAAPGAPGWVEARCSLCLALWKNPPSREDFDVRRSYRLFSSKSKRCSARLAAGQGCCGRLLPSLGGRGAWWAGGGPGPGIPSAGPSLLPSLLSSLLPSLLPSLPRSPARASSPNLTSNSAVSPVRPDGNSAEQNPPPECCSCCWVSSSSTWPCWCCCSCPPSSA